MIKVYYCQLISFGLNIKDLIFWNSFSDLLDDDVADDVRCVQEIYEEHKRLSGNGFNAW